MRAWALFLTLLLLQTPVASIASGPQVPPGLPPASPSDPAAVPVPVNEQGDGVLERLRYNARERTSKAAAELDAGEFERAAESLETAHRLDPDSPTTLYNLGTGHLHSVDPRAIAELEAALESAPPELVSDTAYNLGNARFAANDFQGAVEAYKTSLRTDSGYEDAKFNLELALKKLEEQQQQQQQNDSQSDSDSEGENGESGDEQSPPSDEQNDEGESGDGDQENPQQGNDPDSQESEGEDRQNPLPQFEEQPEMTAEQAAAILEAVDNLERQQRQEDARDQARPAPVGGKDW